MTTQTRPFDPSEYLDSPEAIAAYLEDAFASGDAGEIAAAVGVVARARGMSEFAREAGLARPALYRALSSDGRPELSTLLAVLKVMGLALSPVALSVDGATTVERAPQPHSTRSRKRTKSPA